MRGLIFVLTIILLVLCCEWVVYGEEDLSQYDFGDIDIGTDNSPVHTAELHIYTRFQRTENCEKIDVFCPKCKVVVSTTPRGATAPRV